MADESAAKAETPVAKADKAADDKAGKPPKAAKPGDDIWAAAYFCLLVILLACLAPALCLLLFIGLLPTVIISFIDHSNSRALTYTVGVMNLAALLPFALAALRGNMDTSERTS